MQRPVYLFMIRFTDGSSTYKTATSFAEITQIYGEDAIKSMHKLETMGMTKEA